MPPSTSEWEPPSPEELEAMVPQYEVSAIVGRGGMGAVYKARQVNLARNVAIKVLPETYTKGDDELNFVARFKQEARAMANLDHPAIVSIYDFGETAEGQLYIVMEFIDGMDIHQYLREHGGKLPQESALAITAHVLDALDYAHSHGIVHRDIKPANILLNHEGRIKIADFGLAKKFGEHADTDAPALTMSNIAVGTPDFVAPEALDSSQTPDHRADLYAVGVMLYQMLTGKLPRGLFDTPSELNPEIDPRLDAIVSKAMAANPDNRFQGALAMRADLDLVLSQPLTRVQAGELSGAVAAVVPVTTSLKGGREEKAKSKMPMIAGIAAAAVLVVGLVVMATNQGSKGSQPMASPGTKDGGVQTSITPKSGIAPADNIGIPARNEPGAVAGTLPTAKMKTEPADKSVRVPLPPATKDAPFENSLGMKFVPVPGTDVLFCIHEVRYKDYEEYVKKVQEPVDGWWKSQNQDGFELNRGAADDPVTAVSWDDAQKFCAWLSEKEGKTYRLPTDQEWSVAVGIGLEEHWKDDTTPETVFKPQGAFPWGNVWPPPKGAGNYSDASRQEKAPRSNAAYVEGGYDDGFPTTAPVMSFAANKLGLYDLGGSVWEWCEDLYSSKQKERVLRGGSWHDCERQWLLSSGRYPYAPETRYNNLGFRVVIVGWDGDGAAKPSETPLSGAIELLSLTDIIHDAEGGIWRREGTGLYVGESPTRKGLGNRLSLALPVLVTGSYRIEVEFTKHGRREAVSVLLPLDQDRSVMANFKESGGFAGLVAVRGLTLKDEDNPTRTPHLLENEHRYRAAVQVLLEGDQVDITATFEGEPLFRFQGPVADLDSRQYAMKDQARPGIKSMDSVTWHGVRIQALAGGKITPARSGVKLPSADGAEGTAAE